MALARRKEAATRAARTRAERKAADLATRVAIWRAEHPAQAAWLGSHQDNGFAISLAYQLAATGSPAPAR